MCFRVVFLLCCIWRGSITPLEKSSSAEDDSNSMLLLPVLNSKSWFDPRSIVSLRDTSCFFGSSETSWEKEKRGGTISEHIITLFFVATKVEVWNKVDFLRLDVKYRREKWVKEFKLSVKSETRGKRFKGCYFWFTSEK